MLQRLGHDARDVERAEDRERGLLTDDLLEVFAVHVLVDDERAAVHLVDVVDPDDVLVVEAGGGDGFTLEAGHLLVIVAQVVVEDLDGHPAAEEEVFAQPDRAHAALADVLGDGALAEGLSDAGLSVGVHNGRSPSPSYAGIIAASGAGARGTPGREFYFFSAASTRAAAAAGSRSRSD